MPLAEGWLVELPVRQESDGFVLMTDYMTIGIGFAFAAAVQPGPFLAYAISQSLTNGWKRTLPIAFAPILSDIPIISLVLVILSSVPVGFQQVLQSAGGLFLLYLAWDALKSWRHKEKSPAAAPARVPTVWKAVTVNLLNPNPYLGWSLVMGPLLMKAWQRSPGSGIALLCAFYGTMVITLMGIIIIFGVASNTAPRVSRSLIGISAVALGVFGIIQLWLGLGAMFTG